MMQSTCIPVKTMFETNKFGERFKKWRMDHNVSMYRIAMKIGVSESNLSSMEKGRRPFPDDVLEKIASIEELNISYFQLKAWKILDGLSPEELLSVKDEMELRLKNIGDG